MRRTRGLVVLALVVTVAAGGCGGGGGGIDTTAVLHDLSVANLCVDIAGKRSAPTQKAQVLRDVNNLIENYKADPNANIGRWNTSQSKNKKHTVRDALRYVDRVMATSLHHCNAKAERRAHQALVAGGSS